VHTKSRAIPVCLLLPVLACPVAAQDAPDEAETPASLPAISATADKTGHVLHEVPASVLLLDGLDIAQEGIRSIEQLEARVPGLSFQPFGMSGVNSPVMRGLTANFNSLSSAVLLVVDGVPTLTAQGFEHDFADVRHVEVLRGPQSTLYGRNAESGVIAIHSQPLDDTPRASAMLEAGSRHLRALRFALARPLLENRLYASLSGAWQAQDGFVHNLHSGRKDDARQRQHLNIGVRSVPAAGSDAVLRYARQAFDDAAAPWGAPAAARRQVASGTAGWNHSGGHTASLALQHPFGPALRLHAVTAWNSYRDRVQQDTDFQPVEMLYIGRRHHLRTLSQEVRLHGSAGRADWLAGIYADRSNNHLHSISYSAMLGRADWRAQQKNSATAVFTHWTLPLSGPWGLSGGARIERMGAHLLVPDGAEQKNHWTPVLPKLALQYQFSAQRHAYISTSQGVRSGGFNTLAPRLGYLPFAPEKLGSWEGGLKGHAAKGRMQYTLAVYRMHIRDMQVMQMPMPGTIHITNAATAASQGVEGDMEWHIHTHWQWRAGLAYNHTRFKRFIDGNIDYSGQHNPFAPAWSGHLGLPHEKPGGWYAQASLRASSKVYLDAANHYKRNGYGQMDISSGIMRGDFDISAYVKNLGNKTFDAVGYQNGPKSSLKCNTPNGESCTNVRKRSLLPI